jgi:hypothetical protein
MKMVANDIEATIHALNCGKNWMVNCVQFPAMNREPCLFPNRPFGRSGQAYAEGT